MSIVCPVDGLKLVTSKVNVTHTNNEFAVGSILSPSLKNANQLMLMRLAFRRQNDGRLFLF